MDLASFDFQALQSLDDIQRAIEKLQAAKNLLQSKKAEEPPPPPPQGEEDEGEDLIQIDEIKPDQEDPTEWLVRVEAPDGRSLEELESDKSYLDDQRRKNQNQLLNEVKRLMAEEEREKDKAISHSMSRRFLNLSPSQNVKESPSVGINGIGPPEVWASSPLQSQFGRRMEIEMPDVFGDGESLAENCNRNYLETPPRGFDSRTYTRPKKTRLSLASGELGGVGNGGGIGYNTLTIRRTKPSVLPANLNNNNNNLNETFNQEDVANTTFTKDEEEIDEERQNLGRNRPVRRNESYTVMREEVGNANGEALNTTFTNETNNGEKLNTTFCREVNNASTPKNGLSINGGTPGKGSSLPPRDMNSTFVCDNSNPGSPADPDHTHNLSMEELHVMARRQEQSLKDVPTSRTLTRKETRVLAFPSTFSTSSNRQPSRTSSTDTYCVGQSNPESPGSSASGLSSPVDAQSYDNLESEAFRRSMPDLAITRRLSATGRPSLALMPPPSNTLKAKPHHTSDTRLGSARMSVSSHGRGSSLGLGEARSSSERGSNASLDANPGVVYNRSVVSQPSSGHATIVKAVHRPSTSNVPQSRYSVRPNSGRSSMLPAPGFAQSGIRPVSRIPAPGGPRPRLPGRQGGSIRPPGTISKPPEWKDGCY